MSYFRKTPKLRSMLDLLKREQKWLILINADPDAMASALAMKRILSSRVGQADIARINEISRPDNLAMIRYARLHMLPYDPAMLLQYSHFALVDSQPSHSPLFEGVPFSVIVDHHPVVTEPGTAAYMEILPDYGATCTMFTEYLYNLEIKPGSHLATAMQFGIKTDTMNFQRHVSDIDVRAYQYLGRYADQQLLSRIVRSEFHLAWLKDFAKAATGLHRAGKGYYAYVGPVKSPDVLVVIADMFTRVYEIRWVAVAGCYEDKAVVIFRGDGVSRDMGRMASAMAKDVGSGGGHKTMARAEFPQSAVPGGDLKKFIYKRLVAPLPRIRKKAPEASEADKGGN
ncbi:DHH family phosphoesterase [Desulfovibrio sp. OttesenSCG-928-C14]|nr:DHH family phosphoesterase [Desulfovibrio sp. OttesenSCG-928-C14]